MILLTNVSSLPYFQIACVSILSGLYKQVEHISFLALPRKSLLRFPVNHLRWLIENAS